MNAHCMVLKTLTLPLGILLAYLIDRLELTWLKHHIALEQFHIAISSLHFHSAVPGITGQLRTSTCQHPPAHQQRQVSTNCLNQSVAPEESHFVHHIMTTLDATVSPYNAMDDNTVLLVNGKDVGHWQSHHESAASLATYLPYCKGGKPCCCTLSG